MTRKPVSVNIWMVLLGIVVGCAGLAANTLSAAENSGAGDRLREEMQLQERYRGYRGVDKDYFHAGQQALEKWQDWKFGLRIVEHGVGHYHQTPQEVLQQHKDKEWLWVFHNIYYKYWNPARFDADEYMRRMKRAGMKFFTVATKGHDGLCLWPTQSRQRSARMENGNWVPYDSKYDITVTPFKKDMIGMYVDAGRRHGLGIGLYFSHIDWRDYDFRWSWKEEGAARRNPYEDPGYNEDTDPESWRLFRQKWRQQIEELLTRYGHIDLLCFDGVLPDGARQQEAADLARMVRALQPHILMRRRGIGPYGDYSTPETLIPRDENQPHVYHMPWQTIYNGCDRVSREWLLSTLIEVVAKGGSFQAGFVMNSDGTWPEETIAKTEWVGDWLAVNGEAIYATRPYEPKQWYDVRTKRFTWTNVGGDKRSTLHVPQAGTHRFNIWVREDGSLIDTVLLTQDPSYVPQLACNDRDPGNSVLFEAEGFAEQIHHGDLRWIIGADNPHYSAAGYVVALPNTGVVFTEDQVDRSPLLTYAIDFPKPGTYYVWMRQKSPDMSSDSVFYGLNDSVQGLQHLDLYRGGPDDDGFGSKGYDYPEEWPRIYFTRSKDSKTLYAICVGWPGRELALDDIHAKVGSDVVMLGYVDEMGKPRPLRCDQDRHYLKITLPQDMDNPDNRPCEFAWAFRIQLQ